VEDEAEFSPALLAYLPVVALTLRVAVGPAEQGGVSRITMVVPGDRVIEQLTKQLYKLVNVLKVQDITETPA